MIREGGGRKIQKESDSESLGLGDGSERERNRQLISFSIPPVSYHCHHR